ncbi:MAG: hypothetical protein V4449_02200 [Patescibacteria group bacterium]
MGQEKRRGSPQTETTPAYVTIPEFEKYPVFANRQFYYRKAGGIFTSLIEKAEGLRFNKEKKEIIERIFIVMSVIDFMLDNMKHDKSKLNEFITTEKSNFPSLNSALSELRSLIEKHGNFPSYRSAAIRALSYSGKDSLKDRHREALYLGKAIAVAVSKDTERNKHLTPVLGALTSLGNFGDDVMDYKADGKSKTWALQRANAGIRQVRKLYKVSNKANRYLIGAAQTGLMLYGRRFIPSFLKQTKELPLVVPMPHA